MVGQRPYRPVACHILLEGQPDQRCVLLIEGDGTDFSPVLVAAADVAVPRRCLAQQSRECAAADGGAGLAGDITLLGLTLLLVVQAARPTGDSTGIAEVADLLLADAIALADLAHRHALLVEGDYVLLLRWRKAGVMLAQAPRRGSGYGSRGCSGCSGSVVGRQRPGELQQRLPVPGHGGAESHHKLRIRTPGPCDSLLISWRRQNE